MAIYLGASSLACICLSLSTPRTAGTVRSSPRVAARHSGLELVARSADST